jgi:hypothetical protein
MIFGTTPKFVIKAAEILDSKLLKIELTLVTAGLLSFLLNSFQKDAGELLLTLSLITLSCIYYFIAFKQGENSFDRFTLKLMNFSYSSAIVSILFVLLHWPGGLLIQQMAMIGILLALLSIIFLDKVFKKLTIIDSTNLIRTLVILGLLVLLHFSDGYPS